MSTASLVICYFKDLILSYGDAESHLDIAKRVIDGLTPGLAQIGGVWLPLPHLLMIPFVWNNWLWQTGLGGAIISALAFIVSSLLIYKLTFLFTKKNTVSFLASLVFILNPNILYLQSTPMTELLLIAFFVLNLYFFLGYLENNQLLFLILAGLSGLLASLTRYDGWFLVVLEDFVLLAYLIYKKISFTKIQGTIIIFTTVSFYGIFLWLFWNSLIFKNPFYFTASEFSAKSQQASWLDRGQLPAYHNLSLSTMYYLMTVMANSGLPVLALAGSGIIYFVLDSEEKIKRTFMAFVLLTPFLFYVVSLFLGQSVIFIPSLTPKSFDWQLFNVRYGVMMLPSISFFFAYLFKDSKKIIYFLMFLLALQLGVYLSGHNQIISLTDGTVGLSSAKKVDAQDWLKKNYDYGLVLLDDYARTLSVIRSGIPMKNLIYLGSKPYWEESLNEPEKYARWIILQNKDEVWRKIYNLPAQQARLYKYFNKVYTSEEILIFKRIE